MSIDQRNAGASVTVTTDNTQFSVDRFILRTTGSSKYSAQQNAASVTPPVGFSNYLGITSLAATSLGVTDYYAVEQRIEAFNYADLNWGTANAKTVTLSFWVRSSLTGTFGGNLRNSASDYCYPYSYTISAANTWEQKSVTIAGPTSGTWVASSNGTGIQVAFGLGVGSTYSGTAGSWASTFYGSATGATSVVGTNGATFYITGVQLEVGSTATSFDYRPYGTELALCQRYFEKSYSIDVAPATNTSVGQYLERATAQASGFSGSNILYVVAKRASPTATFYKADGTAGSWNYNRSGTSGTASVALADAGTYQGRLNMDTGSAWAATEIFGHYTLSAEL
jgi:hypothetical protein